jgi:pSer/pThr/pTyr-binding forkhead associated (FHA) protein
MKLKLVAEQTGQSWTLKPKRDYIIGSDSDCDINIERPDVVSSKHLKISFDPTINTWYLYDLGSATGTFVNQQRVNDCPINSQTRIGLGNNYFLTAAPELAPVAQASTAHNSTSTNDGYGHNSYNNGLNGGTTAYHQPVSKGNTSSLQVISWKKYVQQQINKKSSPFAKFSMWFHLITGYRNTPWVRAYGNSTGNNFNAFDGYIIPNFKGSIEKVVSEIQNSVSSLRQYQDTDCYVTKLTDAHIADSASQGFFGVELFPIVRGDKNPQHDYREFLVASHNRVKTYLLVEKYGTDLFVNWITRFEPEPTSIIIGIWSVIAGIVTLLMFASQNLPLIILPFTLWLCVYWGTPLIMESLQVVPKRANANFFMITISLLSLIILMAIAGITMAKSYF